jgi:hypothetical protein
MIAKTGAGTFSKLLRVIHKNLYGSAYTSMWHLSEFSFHMFKISKISNFVTP